MRRFTINALAFVIGFALTVFILTAHADEDHHITIQPVPTSVTNNVTIVNNYELKSTAGLVAMSQLHFDAGSHGLQAAIGMGIYKGETGIALGIARKLGSRGPLISGSITDQTAGIGLTMRF